MLTTYNPELRIHFRIQVTMDVYMLTSIKITDVLIGDLITKNTGRKHPELQHSSQNKMSNLQR